MINMFPKVLWIRFGLKKDNEDMMFLPPAVYNNTRKIILLNADKRVSPKGKFLFSTIFHEFLHHIVNILDLSREINDVIDVIDDIRCRDIVEWIHMGKTKVVFLDKNGPKDI